MDSPAMHLLLPKNRKWLGYLGWMLQDSEHSLAASELETPTEVITEPELDDNKARVSTHGDQSISEPGVDLDLRDLWSADPVPNQVPTIETSSSSPVPSGDDLLLPMLLPDFLVPSPLLVMASPLDLLTPLVLASSSALPPALAPCGSFTSPRASPPLARHEANSPAAPRASRAMSTSGGQRPASATDFQDSGGGYTFHPYGVIGLLPSSDLPVILVRSSVAPDSRLPVITSVPQAFSSASGF
ncbi:hypothetical protein DPX16_7233 [Anabarilius grahami]|uniref:Uncharacterized protein n=1 Tax=Anabarilius grahami TaxID=495550 RepID=A0A3N0XPK2_ANAGA|nr:hypothetical protein DPX16_7233 [Anabarilius grahami]